MVHRIFMFAFCLAFSLATSSVANAANVLNVTGPAPFGFSNQLVMVERWDQVVTYSNVTITMPLADLSSGGPIGGVEGTVYLMNQVGPGTTPANQVAPPVSISGLTASFTTHTLFSGLTLPPGNYYVVVFSTSSNALSSSPEGSSTPVVTTGSGVTFLSGGDSLSPAMYPPASSISFNPPGAPGNLFINVSGDIVPVPKATSVPTMNEWGMIIFMVLAGLGAVYYMRRQRRKES